MLKTSLYSPRVGDPDRPYRPERFYPLCDNCVREDADQTYQANVEVDEEELESQIRKYHGERPFVNLMDDFGFKAVFGDEANVQILIDFINVLLPEGVHVVTLEHAPTEINKETADSKGVRLDLHCTSDDGSHFVVEMQNYPQTYFYKRVVYYGSVVYASTAVPGDEGYQQLKPTYVIAILGDKAGADFDRSDPSWNDDFVSQHLFLEKKHLSHDLKDTIYVTFAEVYRFRKRLEECGSMMDKWLWLLRNIKDISELPKELHMEPFTRLSEAARVAAFTKEKKVQYKLKVMDAWKYNDWMETVRRQGREEGRMEGRVEGAADSRVEIARSMKADGLSEAAIAKYTNLTAEQVAAL